MSWIIQISIEWSINLASLTISVSNFKIYLKYLILKILRFYSMELIEYLIFSYSSAIFFIIISLFFQILIFHWFLKIWLFFYDNKCEIYVSLNILFGILKMIQYIRSFAKISTESCYMKFIIYNFKLKNDLHFFNYSVFWRFR